MIVKVIGAAPFAVSIVLTVFMGGLGLGSYLAGRWIDRVQQPLQLVRIYGLLEIGIGAYGLALPLLLWAFRPLYSLVYNHLFHHFLIYNLTTFLGCSLLLILPVTLMGATLPVLSRFFVTSLSLIGTHIGRLYGLNTIGAAAGSLLCGFLLINYLGVHGSLFFAVILNALIGVICMIASRRWANIFHSPVLDGNQAEDPEEKRAMIVGTGEPVWHALSIFAISGFCAMAYEVIWVKLLGLLVGPTTYSFTIVLVTFITGLALGSIFFGWLSDRIHHPTFLLLITQIIAGLSALAVSQLIGDSQIFFSKLIQHFQNSFTQLILAQSFVLFCFMFLPTFCLGATFPLVGKIYTRSLQQTGKSIGYAYAVNTIGAVLGSFCAGFILIPFIGKELSIRVVTGLQVISALSIWLLLAARKGRKRLIFFPATALVITITCIAIFHYPNWNRLMLAKGKYHRFEQLKNHHLGWMESLLSGMKIHAKDEDAELAFYADGIGGFTSVLAIKPDVFGRQHYALLNSGKADASSQKGDMGTQTLLAHFPMLFHPRPETVLVLGFASGITAGEALHYPIRRLDAVEINQQVVRASEFFRPWNNKVLDDPKTELIIQDGRAHLELTDRTYDIIISEPSNPWMAGLATLFTREFMTLAKERLNKNGVFVQWIHSYQMNWDTFSMVGRTFSSVFPNGMLVSTNPLSPNHGPDFLLIGFQNEHPMDIGIAAVNLPYAQKSINMKLPNPQILYNLVVSENLEILFQYGPINTDNHPYLEYAAPKLLHYTKSADEIAARLTANAWLSSSTIAAIHNNHTSMDRLIDWEFFRFSFNQHGKQTLDLSKADPVQAERYRQLLHGYCSETPLYDFSFITDAKLKSECIASNLNSLSRHLESMADKAEHYYYMGWLCNSNHLPYDAANFFIKALEENPREAKVNDALKKLCQTKDARILYPMLQKALAAQTHNPAFYYHVGILFLRFGQTEAAGNHFSRAVELDSGFLPALNQLATLHLAAGDYTRAIAYYQKMIDLKPRLSPLYYNIACLYARQNKNMESLEWLEKAFNNGYTNWNLVRTDTDLAKLRLTEAYREFMHRNGQGDG